MAIYEKYEGGQLAQRVLRPAGHRDRKRIEGLIAEREQSGDRDGWYREGEWATVEAQRAAVVQRTVAEMLAEVGDDPDRALAALRAEMARDKPRKTLVAKLQELAEPALAVEPEPADDYDALDEPKLDDRLTARGLPTGGNPAEKILRLRAYDMQRQAGDSADESQEG